MGPVRDNAQAFCENISLHGFGYLLIGRNWCERIFWVIIIATSLTTSSIIVHKAYT